MSMTIKLASVLFGTQLTLAMQPGEPVAREDLTVLRGRQQMEQEGVLQDGRVDGRIQQYMDRHNESLQGPDVPLYDPLRCPGDAPNNPDYGKTVNRGHRAGSTDRPHEKGARKQPTSVPRVAMNHGHGSNINMVPTAETETHESTLNLWKTSTPMIPGDYVPKDTHRMDRGSYRAHYDKSRFPQTARIEGWRDHFAKWEAEEAVFSEQKAAAEALWHKKEAAASFNKAQFDGDNGGDTSPISPAPDRRRRLASRPSVMNRLRLAEEKFSQRL